MKQNVEEAKRALTEKALFATSVERFLILDEFKSAYKELPQTRRFSKILSILLSRVSTPIEPYDLIAGRCVDRELNEAEEKAFAEYIKHPDYPANHLFYSSGHGTYSWELLVKKGIVGLREMAIERLSRAEDAEQQDFLTAMIEIYDAILAYIRRYAAQARAHGMEETAKNLETVAIGAPDSFASALQLLWIVTMINCAYVSENPTLTVGRLDQILYPLYQADIEKGILTRERAGDYITDYYCKHNLIMGRGEHQVGDETNSTTFSRIANFDAPQYLLLAGTDAEGNLAVNDLTELFAERIEPTFKNPVVVVRYVKDMDKSAPALWKTLTERALASASMMFYNDGNVTSTYRRLGLPPEDAARYEHFGCNWCSAGDRSAWMQTAPKSAEYHAYITPEEQQTVDIPFMRTNCPHGWAEDFMIVLRTLAERDAETVTIEDFYDLFFARMEAFIDRKLAILSRDLEIRQRHPSRVMNFGDCFLEESIQNAACATAKATYHFELQPFQMFGTVADCFIAVDQLVMIEKKLTLERLLQATEADFEGFPGVLALCRKAEKYGMDTPLSNQHAKRISRMASDLVIEKSRPYFEKQRLFLIPCMQSDTWHLKYGEMFGATPDGRRAHTSFSQNTRPTNGACKNGLTGMFNSMLNLPHDGLVSGALNLDVDRAPFQGESGTALFASLLAAYFNQGGLHAQVSALGAKDLIEAQKNPAAYRDLRVRVTGYSGVFVDLCERLQNDVIERFQ